MAYTNIDKGMLISQRDGKKNVFEVASGVTVYDGAAVLLNGGKATYAVTAGDIFAGVAADTGDEKVGVYATGVFKFNGTGLTSADIGKVAYLSTGGSGNPGAIVTTAPGSKAVKIGVIVGVDGETVADVRIDGFALKEVVE